MMCAHNMLCSCTDYTSFFFNISHVSFWAFLNSVRLGKKGGRVLSFVCRLLFWLFWIVCLGEKRTGGPSKMEFFGLLLLRARHFDYVNRKIITSFFSDWNAKNNNNREHNTKQFLFSRQTIQFSCIDTVRARVIGSFDNFYLSHVILYVARLGPN